MKDLLYIKVSLGNDLFIETELFSVLEQLFPVKFIFDEQSGVNIVGVIVRNTNTNKDRDNITTLSLFPPVSLENDPHFIVSNVIFSDIADIPFPFRGRKVNTNISTSKVILSGGYNEKVLAVIEEGPIWAVSEIGGVKHFRSALGLPFITNEHGFNDVFNGDCFLQMLVLLEFIREVTSGFAYQNAPLRASFIIDDPNLHWPRYGFFDYREIVDVSKKENFHMSFATIPLDNWYTHVPTADIFRNNPQRISLLIHGNNHAKHELGLDYSEGDRKALLRQAIDRIRRLEEKANVPVSRVMVPPHGACSNDMLAALPTCGFESACISAGSLRFHNPDRPWVKTLGFSPSEIIEGCPVLPRWGLTGNVENTLLIAAYLGQPLILRGHHQDLKGGGGKFIEFARFINSLGNVFWSNMTDISRLNYQWRKDGNAVRIKPFGLNVLFKLPENVTEIIIDAPSSKFDDESWQIIADTRESYNIKSGERFVIGAEMGSEVSIVSNFVKHVLPPDSGFKSTPIKFLLRRLLTETRDRMLLD